MLLLPVVSSEHSNALWDNPWPGDRLPPSGDGRGEAQSTMRSTLMWEGLLQRGQAKLVLNSELPKIPKHIQTFGLDYYLLMRKLCSEETSKYFRFFFRTLWSWQLHEQEERGVKMSQNYK